MHTHSAPHSHHGHGHSHAQPGAYGRAFLIGTALNVLFIGVEVGVGLGIQSLALLADAVHNLSDVLGLLLAWAASWLTQQPPTATYTYGFRRSSILAALFNGLLLMLAMGGILWEAVQRLGQPAEVSGGLLMGVAGVGVVINGLTAVMFMSGRHHDLNLRGAFLHMAADALVSLGVVLTGLGLLLTGWAWLDPVISIAIALFVLYTTWGLLSDALRLSMDRVPRHIEPALVQTFLQELPGVQQVHDLHIWPMSTTETALTAHLVMPAGSPGDGFLAQLAQQLKQSFGIGHVTVQVETDDQCRACNLM
ncbi:MAG: cation diffusion facilitator family transporter [Cyanobacteria bacterium J06554_6]